MTLTNSLKLTGLAAGVLTLTVVSPAWSHHSHAMYDHTKEVAVTGTVAEFVFRNPHVFLHVDVKTESGEMVRYSIEMSNIPNMIRRGIGQATFKTGDQVMAKVHPLRDGRPGGNYVTIVAADGKLYD
jgi:hypothetical protein